MKHLFKPISSNISWIQCYSKINNHCSFKVLIMRITTLKVQYSLWLPSLWQMSTYWQWKSIEGILRLNLSASARENAVFKHADIVLKELMWDCKNHSPAVITFCYPNNVLEALDLKYIVTITFNLVSYEWIKPKLLTKTYHLDICAKQNFKTWLNERPCSLVVVSLRGVLYN